MKSQNENSIISKISRWEHKAYIALKGMVLVMRRLGGISICALLCVSLLSGCGSSLASDESIVSVSKKGKVTAIDVESFEASYYDEEELRSFVKTAVDEYNTTHEKGAVKMKQLSVADAVATVEMHYKTVADYAEFNGIELYQGTNVQALAEGYDFEVELAAVEDGVMGQTVSKAEIFESDDWKVVIIKANTDVKVDGKICYVSTENVEVTGKDTVSIGMGDAESFETDVYTYIIYK